MIRNNLNLVVCSFDMAPPFLEAINDGKECFVACIIVDFRRVNFREWKATGCSRPLCFEDNFIVLLSRSCMYHEVIHEGQHSGMGQPV